MDRIILRPSRQPVAGTGAETVWLQHAGGRLQAFVHRDPSALTRRIVLKFPGTAGRGERAGSFPAAEYVGDDSGHPPSGIRRQPWDVWAWNPPGYGGSDGRASLQNLVKASLDYVDQVLRQYDVDVPVTLMGNSLGCCVAANVAVCRTDRYRLDSVILRNPPPLKAVVRRVAAGYPGGRFLEPVLQTLPESLDLNITLPNLRLPVVVIQSERDRLVPVELQDETLSELPIEPKRVRLPDADHHDAPTDEQYSEIAEALRAIIA